MFQYTSLGFLVGQMCKAYHDRQETFTTWLLATAARPTGNRPLGPSRRSQGW
jgi:hypothetical protein